MAVVEGKGEDRALMLEKAYITIILCLGDKALRKVANEDTTKKLWEKLNKTNMVKSLANSMLMKQRLYSFKIMDDKYVFHKLDDFSKIIDDMEYLDVKLEGEDKALIL